MLSKHDLSTVRGYMASKARHHGGTMMAGAKASVKPALVGAVAYYGDKYLQGKTAGQTAPPMKFYTENWYGPGVVWGVAALLAHSKAPQYAMPAAVVAGMFLARGYDTKPADAKGYGDAGAVQWAAPNANAAGLPANDPSAAGVDDAGAVQALGSEMFDRGPTMFDSAMRIQAA